MDDLIQDLHTVSENHKGSRVAKGEHWFIEEQDDAIRLKDLTTIFEINKVIGQEKDLDHLLLRVVHEITTAMNAERSTLYLYDEEKREIWAKVAEGLHENGLSRLPLGTGIAGIVAQELRTEVVNDPYVDPRFNKDVDARTGFRTRNMICMPILGREVELLGVIQVLNKKNGKFDYGDESKLSALAVYIGLTLENSLFFCSLRPKCEKVCQ
jgi:signal transduction protein with GAF and PtsI domain